MNDFLFYHGAVFAKIVHHSDEKLFIQAVNTSDNAAYEVNGNFLYIKYSTKRLSPWMFTYSEDNFRNFINFSFVYKRSFAVFVCNNDGICVIKKNELLELFSGEVNSSKTITISTGRNKSYTVRGTDGELPNKASRTNGLEQILSP
ncbi:MAG: hypothetical protein QM537_02040 [Candidatus Symbiobacter sp.]|nr:hypothetical protein [Candidatus Symbiobacter sp.]